MSAVAVAAECAGCLDEFVPCRCGDRVRAGSGHPDCPVPNGPWYGFWLCSCGHCTRHHRQWWDTDDDGGFGCDFCACPNPWKPDDGVPF